MIKPETSTGDVETASNPMAGGISFDRQREWNSVLQGDASAAFTATVAEVNKLIKSGATPTKIHAAVFMGVANNGPSHPLQVWMAASLKAPTPGVHIIFTQLAAYKRTVMHYFRDCAAHPEGEPVCLAVQQHVLTDAFMTAWLEGNLASANFDPLYEASLLAAVKLEEQPPKRRPAESRMTKYSDIDVETPMVLHLLRARGLKGTDPSHRMERVIQWGKKYLMPVLEGSPSVLADRLVVWRRIYMQALGDLGEHAISVRRLGRLDVGPLVQQIPAASTVWAMMAAADESIKGGVEMRAHHPSMWAELEKREKYARDYDASDKRKRPAAEDVSQPNRLANNYLKDVEDKDLTPTQLAKRQQNRKTKEHKQTKQPTLDGWVRPEAKGKGRGRGGKGDARARGKGDQTKGKGRGKGGKGGSSVVCGWNEDGSFHVAGTNYLVRANDGSGKTISDVVGLPEPICWPWCIRRGACFRKWHQEHQGEEGMAHSRITDKHREQVQQLFRQE